MRRPGELGDRGKYFKGSLFVSGIRTAALFCGAILVATPAVAQTTTSGATQAPAGSPGATRPAAPPPGFSFGPPRRRPLTLGFGMAVGPSYDGSNDILLLPSGIIRGNVDGFNFATRGLQLGVDMIRDKGKNGLDIQFGPVIGINLNRANRLIDPQVSLLGKRRVALETGGFVAISKTGIVPKSFDTLTARLQVVGDVSGVHRSFVITPSIEYTALATPKLQLGASISGTFVGDGYARSYFAVDAAGSARSRLPVFANPRGGFKNFTLGANANYAFKGFLRRGWLMFATVSYSQLQGDFAASPIVSIAGNRNQVFGAFGLGYTF